MPNHADDIDLTLPPELDRLNGVVTELAEHAPAVGGAAPPIKDEDEVAIIAEGRKAFERRKADARTSWRDWVLLGKAIHIGHEEAKQKAGGKTNGNKYSAAFHHWLKDNGFLDIDKVIDKSDRTKLIWLVNRLPDIEAWRKTKTEAQLAEWNHPTTVWRIAHCKDRGLPEFKVEQSGETSSTTISTTTGDDSGARAPDHEPKAETKKETKKKKNNWNPGQLSLVAQKAMGLVADLKLKGGWTFPEPPDLRLVAVWWELAWAVTNIANVLDEANGQSPQGLPLKVRCKRELAASCFLTEEELAERPPVT